MKTRHSDSIPLREVLRAAVSKRKELFWRGRSLRKDSDAMRAAIARAEAFLSSYPYANDLRVRSWCMEHHTDVAMIVPGNAPTQLARLIMQALKPTSTKNEAA